MRRDAESDVVGQHRRDPVVHRLEALVGGARIVSEHLEEDRAAQPELCTGGRRRADEAAVAHGRDSRAEAVEGAEPGDRLHVLDVDPRLARDVDADPVGEAEAVAEAGVHLVLEVRVRVDEGRKDHRLVEVVSLPDLVGRAHCRDGSRVVYRDGAVSNRRSLDGNDPVRRDRPHG